MSITPELKKEVITKNARHKDDTGSPQVQVAILTERINNLNQTHFTKHKKDNSGRLGLLKMVNSRRRILQVLSKKNPSDYTELINKLGLNR